MLEFYQAYRRMQLTRRLLCYGAGGLLGAWLILHSSQSALQQQQHQLHAHWQRAWHAAQLQHRQTHPPKPSITAPTPPPGLTQQLRAILQAWPQDAWLASLQLAPHHFSLHGGYTSSSTVLHYCQQLLQHFPSSARHHLSFESAQDFRFELRTTAANPPLPSAAPSVATLQHYYAWLKQEIDQHHLQLLSSQQLSQHTLRLRFIASFVTMEHVLAQLDRLFGPQACLSLSLQSTSAALVQVSVLCH